ncbi:hypothetical protein SPRA44_670025 [Serratia proteamaculans]|nr:hypothetical protein SPRA44_670025 [Serratia proteamaculans]
MAILPRWWLAAAVIGFVHVGIVDGVPDGSEKRTDPPNGRHEKARTRLTPIG